MKWLAVPFVGVILASVVPVGALGNRAPVPVVPVETRTYKFKATIKDNAGVTPLKVGESITGQFTYDLKSEPVRKGKHWARYKSKHNALVVEYGDLRFVGTGEITTTITSSEDSEHFSFLAPDLMLPKGWEMDHKGVSQTYGILFQNNPSRKVFDGIVIPSKLSLDDFKDVKELRLAFFHGVSFPGGAVKEIAIVTTVVESLEEVRRKN